jgi:dienelactone hydrolase
VVLIYDPIGQGERLQYPDADLKSKIGVGVREHLYAGNQQFLVGEFFGAWRAWDGIRALDYLLSRKEVDPAHIGVTGNSGGGTMTTWLCGVDQRYTMAAPACFVTSFRRNLENELPADTEQCPPRAIALGLDHEDFLAALAPKPVIILTKERDYFDVRGSEAAFARLKRLYRLLGAEDNIALFTGPTGHGFSQENREAMYRWFNRTTGVSDQKVEPEITIEKDETLYCAPNGQVSELESKPVYHFTADTASHLKESRGNVSGRQLEAAIGKVLNLDVPETSPDYRILRARRSRKYPTPHATTYAVETEPGIQALVYLLGDERHDARPPRGRKRAILYVPHLSSDTELRHETFLRELPEREPESAFYTCDVRGCGESQPDTCGQDSFLQPYGSDYFYAIHALMLDDPYPAQRVRDLLRVIQWLTSHGHEQVHLVAKGRGTVHAAIAALLSAEVVQVTLQDALPSFHEVATSETYDWPLSCFILDVLKHVDLPDIYRELEQHKGLRFL